MELRNDLQSNRYPGRGIVIGITPDGRHAAAAYFIMGRSENSRNRVFAEDGDGIRTKAFDESKLTDPSLIIYHPVRVLGENTIITNGDQTDTVYEHIKAGGSFEGALRTRRFEPDAPNYTPRVSGIITVRGKDTRYSLSILKSAAGNPASDERFFFDYEHPVPGQGHFIHTYKCDGSPIPSYEGEPKTVDIEYGDVGSFACSIWEALDFSNKVSLFCRYIDLFSGKYETKIINKNK